MNSLFSRQSWMVGLLIACTAHAAQFKFATQTLTVPDGFEVELVTTPKLVERPISGSFDELGRLYVTDSSGSNAKPAEQTNNPTHRIVRLEDTDGDGKFDKSVVFADKMMFPEGCLYYDGSVYVSAPPSIWKLTDTNNDGVADVRVEWHQGKTLTGCANDLHGPYLGPDGWIYWCKGAFAEQTYEVNGKPFTTRAAHIFRARPDHTGLEPVMTGGMDNPVGLTFTADGERILCGTFFVTHEPGHRDGLIHAIYGGVYGKINAVTDDHIKTGDLMPIMTHMGPAAPAAVTRYESRIFGDEYRDNLFCCQFNMHKVSRHILEPDGATFKTKDSDFIVSDSNDFHPTDVIEDADGSLLVLDTGPWYKLCCPTSQLAKPDLLGAIYRIRRKGAPKIEDPRGLKLEWSKLQIPELASLLGDERPAVTKRAIGALAKQGNKAVPALQEIVLSGNRREFKPANPLHDRLEWIQQETQWEKEQIARLPNKLTKRQNAVWTLTRINTTEAQKAVHLAVNDYEDGVCLVACQSFSLLRDKEGAHKIANLRHFQGFVKRRIRRTIIEALGRTASWDSQLAQRFFEIPSRAFQEPKEQLDSMDRIEQHSLSYSLIESDAKAVAEYLADVVALDQLDGSKLKAEQVIDVLRSPMADRQRAAVWVTSHHPEWGDALVDFFREQIEWKEIGKPDLSFQDLLPAFARNSNIQKLIAEMVESPVRSPATRKLLLRIMAEADLAATPHLWVETVPKLFYQNDPALVREAIATANVLGHKKKGAADFTEALEATAHDPSRSDEVRLEALAALPKGLKTIEPPLQNFLFANLDPSKPVPTRNAAVSVLTKAKLNQDQLAKLAEAMKTTGPLEVSKLLTAFEHTTNEAVGLKLMASLKESKGLSGARPDALKTLAAKYPPSVQQEADKLIASLNVDAGKQKAHIDDLVATLPKGDVRNGQAIFNSPKAACSSCHKMGYVGGTVGPDLTVIGTVRTERDLLEAVVYPSASFVRSYEPFVVHTKSDEDYSGVLRKDAADEIILATGPNADVRIARSDIVEMRPGTVSVMPAGMDQLLTKQELADIVTFLKNTKWGPQ